MKQLESKQNKWFDSLNDKDKKSIVFQVLGYDEELTIEEINLNISSKEIEQIYNFRKLLKKTNLTN